MKRKMVNRLKRYKSENSGELCLHCGKRGPHFIPPSAGEPGRFSCVMSTRQVLGELYTERVGKALEAFTPFSVKAENDAHELRFTVEGDGWLYAYRLSRSHIYKHRADVVAISLECLLRKCEPYLKGFPFVPGCHPPSPHETMDYEMPRRAGNAY